MPLCSRCGKELIPNLDFYIHCGTSLTVPIPAQSSVPTPHVKKSHAKRNLVVVLILIVVVGSLGVVLFRPGRVADAARSPKPAQTGAPVISDEKVKAAASYALDWFSEAHSRNEHFAVRDEVYKATAIFWYV